ncbi:T9SS type B sorting domain-containing protein [Winogradskyella sediminis]|uniref:Gliding motility-associated C-terminal domain-containing protein n=1 Tax=Winogradskyella sediminis TaxID=1382466 RepID=A0A1H1V7P2_9FLAO|nr:T9SS type B sorting domain-containing protein [Winogradskyella sediminis]SDS80758.1 gliding motility-associated C-terminal domain-containing protein [Winogradskyella sediminis]
MALYTKYFLLIIGFIGFSTQLYAQLCEGSLGDPVVEINFGSGSGRGSALGTDITAFTYNAAGELDEGEYTIANTTSGLKANAWHTTSDHTGDTNGYMMVINSAVIANEGVFYTKTVEGLCADTTYEFSAWLMNIMNPSAGTDQYHPNVTFRISDTSGNILGSYNTGDIAQTTSGSWQQYGFFFTLEAETEAVITILNSAPSAHPGNDIALDDIAFRPCGPTIESSIVDEVNITVSVCQDEVVSYIFKATVSEGYTDPQYQWQYSDDLGETWNDLLGETNLEFEFTDTTNAGLFNYRLTAANGNNITSESCRITSEEFSVEIFETPNSLTGESEQIFCSTQNATIALLEVNANAIWYDDLITGNLLTTTTPLVNGTTYYAAQETINGCESDERFAVTVYIVEPSLIIHDINSIICDTNNDNIETINLTDYESDLTACNDCIFTYYTSEDLNEDSLITTPESFIWDDSLETVYTKIESTDKCYQKVQITLTLGVSPYINIDDIIAICEQENYKIIDAGYGFNSYEWSTGDTSQTITVTDENLGEYWVTVYEDYGSYSCTSTKTFQIIASNSATISHINIEDWTVEDNSITIHLDDTSNGDYEYSIDGINFQESNRFTSLFSGEYDIYVRDKNECGITTARVYLLNYPKYFTPNGDGEHDTWYIKNSNAEPNMLIKIFNRYGKLLKVLDTVSAWDGTYNGNDLPTSDYWFQVIRENGETFVGHFTLKR